MFLFYCVTFALGGATTIFSNSMCGLCVCVFYANYNFRLVSFSYYHKFLATGALSFLCFAVFFYFSQIINEDLLSFSFLLLLSVFLLDSNLNYLCINIYTFFMLQKQVSSICFFFSLISLYFLLFKIIYCLIIIIMLVSCEGYFLYCSFTISRHS